MSQWQWKVTAAGKADVNSPDKPLVMDEFTFVLRKGEGAYLLH